MKSSAQCWILTIERHHSGAALGVLTVCGDGTNGEPLSYESVGSLSSIFQELECVLDATMYTFEGIAEGRLSEGQLPLV